MSLFVSFVVVVVVVVCLFVLFFAVFAPKIHVILCISDLMYFS